VFERNDQSLSDLHLPNDILSLFSEAKDYRSINISSTEIRMKGGVNA